MKLKPLLCVMALCLPLPALAQTAAPCPELPATTGLSWESSAGEDFLFCKAVREDGFQAFSVMLRGEEESRFRERFSLREEKGLIDGHEVRWYRGNVPDAIVRETLIELDDDLTAHIMLRVDNEEQLAESLRLAESIRFGDTRMGSN